MTRMSLETGMPIEYEMAPWITLNTGWLDRLHMHRVRRALGIMALQ